MSEAEPEITDLVNEQDEVIGQIERDDSINNVEVHGGYIRVVDCYIINSRGELWVPRRTAHKRIVPNGLDFSVGEHMRSGEEYVDAMVRGFKEELSFTPDVNKLRFLGAKRLTHESDMFQGFFTYEMDDDPDYNPDDFTDAEWLSPEQLIERIENGETAKSNTVPTVRMYLLNNG